MAFEANAGTSRLASVLSRRMKKESASPPVLDFGEIQADGSLITNMFPVPIPKGDYSVLRQLTLGISGAVLTVTEEGGGHGHTGGSHGGHGGGDGSHEHTGGTHRHTVVVPESMRSAGPGDRVLVAWVQTEAVVVGVLAGRQTEKGTEVRADDGNRVSGV